MSMIMHSTKRGRRAQHAEADIRHALRLYAKGVPYADIKSATGLSKGTVQGHASRRMVQRDRRKGKTPRAKALPQLPLDIPVASWQAVAFYEAHGVPYHKAVAAVLLAWTQAPSDRR